MPFSHTGAVSHAGADSPKVQRHRRLEGQPSNYISACASAPGCYTKGEPLNYAIFRRRARFARNVPTSPNTKYHSSFRSGAIDCRLPKVGSHSSECPLFGKYRVPLFAPRWCCRLPSHEGGLALLLRTLQCHKPRSLGPRCRYYLPAHQRSCESLIASAAYLA